jgi:hypothetical protein
VAPTPRRSGLCRPRTWTAAPCLRNETIESIRVLHPERWGGEARLKTFSPYARKPSRELEAVVAPFPSRFTLAARIAPVQDP